VITFDRMLLEQQNRLRNARNIDNALVPAFQKHGTGTPEQRGTGFFRVPLLFLELFRRDFKSVLKIVTCDVVSFYPFLLQFTQFRF
jgi:hypothetical protein